MKKQTALFLLTFLFCTLSFGQTKSVPQKSKLSMNQMYKCIIQIDVSSNWITITSPDETVQTITYPNQSLNPYKLNLNIKTKLKSADVIIGDYFYKPTGGGLGEFQRTGIKMENDGTFSLDCYLVTGSKKMTGELIVQYGIIPTCPE